MTINPPESIVPIKRRCLGTGMSTDIIWPKVVF